MYKEEHSRVEEMQAGASSFPERVETEASDVHSSVEHAHCLSSTMERDSLGLGCLHQHTSNMLWPAILTYYNNTVTIQRQRNKWGGGVNNIVTDYTQYVDDLIAILCFPSRLLASVFILCYLPWCPYPFISSFSFPPTLLKRKRSLLDPPPVLHNQIFDLMKGFNYWLPSTGGVGLLLPLFIFPAIYHYPDSKGVYTFAIVYVCAHGCVNIFFEAACWRSECGPVYKFAVSWPLETVLAEWLVENGI